MAGYFISNEYWPPHPLVYNDKDDSGSCYVLIILHWIIINEYIIHVNLSIQNCNFIKPNPSNICEPSKKILYMSSRQLQKYLEHDFHYLNQV
ncbi:hypothetical protein DERP_014146 [Dermatophagoides pteronyssinus]|uniref:Uncharacterized protein n=1 Tax=Dermatophagoides pteronyssinus TaxID=6956 RepID=A0ABQ8IXF8_DERPT|nr:hypothetical protein DERP_014146 [Dermatophagoides pteronyssinus]